MQLTLTGIPAHAAQQADEIDSTANAPRLSTETFTTWRDAAAQVFLPRDPVAVSSTDTAAAWLAYDTACLRALREIPCPECGSTEIDCLMVGLKRGTAGVFFRTDSGGIICPRIHKTRKLAANQAFDIARGIPRSNGRSIYWGVMRVFPI